MKTKLIPIVLLVLAVAAVVGIKNRKQQEPAGIVCESGMCVLPIPQEKMQPADAAAAPVDQPLPKLLDLGAGKCIPCKMMAPILDEMKESFAGQLDVEFIDVWENQSAGEQYGIRMIPTQIFFDADGRELFRHEGFYAREDMVAKWNELGFTFGEPKKIEQELTSNKGNG
ncbi:thioredoxin family protein [Pontiella sp.]|uniref:thioredoxin family protein n=1 Tax=Pontiella sp. TaxID=2837462 RepID=UPI0035618020